MYKLICLLFSCLFFMCKVNAPQPEGKPMVSTVPVAGGFQIAVKRTATKIYVSASDFAGVKIAVKNFQRDVKAVTNSLPEIADHIASNQMIIVGTIGKGGMIDSLIQKRRINVTGIAGKWEAHLTTGSY